MRRTKLPSQIWHSTLKIGRAVVSDVLARVSGYVGRPCSCIADPEIISVTQGTDIEYPVSDRPARRTTRPGGKGKKKRECPSRLSDPSE